MKKNKLKQPSPQSQIKSKQYSEQANYISIIEKIKFIQTGLNDAAQNNNYNILQFHIAQYAKDIQMILDFITQNEYAKICKDYEQVKEQKKQLSNKIEALELQNLLRDKSPEDLINQIQLLVEQNKKLQEKISKLKQIAEQAQQQALESLELSNLNQALFQQIKFDSDSSNKVKPISQSFNSNQDDIQQQIDEKNQEIEMLKLQLEDLSQQQQSTYEEHQQEIEHHKMWINQLSNKLQLYEQQAEIQRIRYEQKILELEQKLQSYETFDENSTSQLLQSLIDDK